MIELDTTIWLWRFCYKYTDDIIFICATTRFELQGHTPYEIVMNYTPTIYEYVSFSWFQWSWFYYESLKSKHIYRWVVPAHGFGKAF